MVPEKFLVRISTVIKSGLHIRWCRTCALLLLIIRTISAGDEKVILLDHVGVLELILIWCSLVLFNNFWLIRLWHTLRLNRLIRNFLVGHKLLLLRLVFLRVEFDLVSFKELVFRIIQALFVYVLLFFIIIVVILFFIDF